MAETNAVAGMAHGLPVMVGSFVGRDRDVTALGDLLAASRLVTVVGPAGMGKTRLVAETAVRLAADYPDGAWYVDLAGVADDEDVITRVRAVLSMSDAPGRPSPRTLAWALRDRRLLLVLDHGDQVGRAAGNLTGALLQGCPQVAVLAAGEQALGSAGEAVWNIPSLSLPATEQPGDAEPPAGSGAVRLFADRLRRRWPDVAVGAGTGQAVAALCRRLRGMPLAIELAAAATGPNGPADLPRHLPPSSDAAGHEAGRVLVGGADGGGPDEALRAALACSHERLSDAERVLWRRLAVFAGGCTADAAVEVCGGGDLGPGAVPGLLGRLTARSLLVVEAGTPPRYRLLQPVREHATALLDDAGETAGLQARHAAWCVTLGERAEGELAAGDQRAWLARLEAEHDNLRAALATARDGDDSEVIVRLAGALVLFWSMRGRFHEGRRWLEAAVAAGAGSPRERATVRWGAALMARALGNHSRAMTRARDALASAGEVGDPRLCARALGVLGVVGITTRDHHQAAMDQLSDSLALARRAGDAWSEVGALTALGTGHVLAGEAEAGRARFQECLAVADQADEQTGQAHPLHALVGLARVELATGDHLGAERRLRHALVRARTLGIPPAATNALRYLGRAVRIRGDEHTQASPQGGGRGADRVDSDVGDLAALGRLALSRGDTSRARGLLHEARALANAEGLGSLHRRLLVEIGAVERVAGDPAEARSRLEEALAAARAADEETTAAWALHELGRLARAGGDDPRGASLHHEALVLLRRAGDGAGVVACLEALGGLAARQADAQGAARLFGAAAVVRDACAIPRPPVDQAGYAADVAVLRGALDPGDVAAAWAQGTAVALDDVIAAAAPASHG